MLNRIRHASDVSSSTMSNTQRVAVVTGANKGIGFAIVRALCKQLDNGIVYLTARNEERGREAVARLNQEGLQPKFHQLDVTDRASVSQLRDFLHKTHGGLDILVNNAGVYHDEESSLPLGEKASVTMAINFDAALDISRALIPLIRAHGRIVNVSSLIGVWAFQKMTKELQGRFQGAKTEQEVEQLMHEFVTLAKAGSHAREGWPEMVYGISKMGVIALTRIQADDIAKDKTKGDVLLTCCCPGYVATDMTNCQGQKTIDEGAVTPVYCALLPPGSSQFNGKMFSEKKLVEFW
ncbi:carbonyl reductase [NADPH] 1-like isoform X2 [Acanthaster planci]|uniref:carbonyl reductase (NADPH) n=1 Tax=Acanthaster planci TaxID=133434 RepID=A0A8B7XIK2_ACAPL|nr:carbonyl reductase [NADPH] 1-like isoform X2 [Acanthaster planci]XP_022080036.1 carbonyl reductase [NADPH] 1-like isoform X2 [Acanthaster planci]